MIVSTLKAYKKGKEACFAGMPFNTNPHLGKSGVIAKIQQAAWNKGFLETERSTRGA